MSQFAEVSNAVIEGYKTEVKAFFKTCRMGGSGWPIIQKIKLSTTALEPANRATIQGRAIFFKILVATNFAATH